MHLAKTNLFGSLQRTLVECGERNALGNHMSAARHHCRLLFTFCIEHQRLLVNSQAFERQKNLSLKLVNRLTTF